MTRKRDIPIKHINSEPSGIEENIKNYLEKPIGSGPRADFKPEYFDSAIATKGYKMLWESAMVCPCQDPISGQPDVACKHCFGLGYFYYTKEHTRAIVTSINGRKDQTPIGIRDAGTAYLTPVSVVNMGFRDRVTFTDFRAMFGETLLRTEQGDGLRYRCLEVSAMMWEGKMYNHTVDFNIIRGELQDYVEWITQDIPLGERYSIQYQTHPSYVCMGPMHEIRGTYTMYHGQGEEVFVALPKQFLIKREDFLENGVPNRTNPTEDEGNISY